MAELKLEGPHTPLPPPVGPGPSRGLSGLQITGIVLGAMAVTVAVTLFLVKSWLFPAPFKPVRLSAAENLRWLVAHSQAHVHADLIFGLPGETLERAFMR